MSGQLNSKLDAFRPGKHPGPATSTRPTSQAVARKFTTPKLSFVLSYYRQPEALLWQLDLLQQFSSEIELIVVDDGSQDGFPASVLSESSVRGKLIELRTDVRWNLPGARNWGMVLASAEQCFRSDIDHRPLRETLQWMLSYRLKHSEAYRFARVREGLFVKPHGDSYFIRKNDYWRVGGYDERLSGFYGQNENDFLSRAQAILHLRRSNLSLELLESFKSEGGSRSIYPNLVRYQVLKAFPNRDIRRLRVNIEVTDF